MQFVHTKTQEEFNNVLDIFNEYGLVWEDGEKPLKHKSYWEDFGNKTCLTIEACFSFCSRRYCESDDENKVITYNNFIKNKQEIMQKVEKRKDEITPLLEELKSVELELTKSVIKITKLRNARTFLSGLTTGVFICILIEIIQIIIK